MSDFNGIENDDLEKLGFNMKERIKVKNYLQNIEANLLEFKEDINSPNQSKEKYLKETGSEE